MCVRVRQTEIENHARHQHKKYSWTRIKPTLDLPTRASHVFSVKSRYSRRSVRSLICINLGSSRRFVFRTKADVAGGSERKDWLDPRENAGWLFFHFFSSSSSASFSLSPFFFFLLLLIIIISLLHHHLHQDSPPPLHFLHHRHHHYHHHHLINIIIFVNFGLLW